MRPKKYKVGDIVEENFTHKECFKYLIKSTVLLVPIIEEGIRTGYEEKKSWDYEGYILGDDRKWRQHWYILDEEQLKECNPEDIKDLPKEIKKCEHKHLEWHDTSIGGFAQCVDCAVVIGDDNITEEDCINYVTLEVREKRTKKIRARDLKKRRDATIAYLKRKGLPYHEDGKIKNK